MNHFMQCFVT